MKILGRKSPQHTFGQLRRFVPDDWFLCFYGYDLKMCLITDHLLHGKRVCKKRVILTIRSSKLSKTLSPSLLQS